MATVTVIAKVVAKKDCIDDVKAALLKLVAPTRNEEGCSEYRLHQDNEDPAQFIFYENWQSPACLQQHMNSSHFQEYLAAVDGLIAGKVVNQLTSLA